MKQSSNCDEKKIKLDKYNETYSKIRRFIKKCLYE